MKKFKHYLFAIAAFLRTLFSPAQRVVGFSANGYSLLEGWETAPEEEVLKSFDKLCLEKEQPPTMALFGYDGPHQGELMLLKKKEAQVSVCANGGLTVTPGEQSSLDLFHLNCGKQTTLESKRRSNFFVNQTECQKAELIDYDELGLLGNQFLYLDLKGE